MKPELVSLLKSFAISRDFSTSVSIGMSEKEFENGIETLDKLLFILHDKSDRIEKTLNDLGTISANQLEYYIKDYLIVEKFMRLILEYTNPERFSQKNEAQWKLMDLYKNEFGVVPSEYPDGKQFNLTQEAKIDARLKYRISSERDLNKQWWSNYPFLYWYLTLYYYRNDEAHRFSNLDQDAIYSIRKAFVLCTLDLCNRNAEQIGELYFDELFKQKFNAEKYCKEIIMRYEKDAEDWTYAEILWQNPKSESNAAYTAGQLIELLDDQDQIKLTGIAGAGKTTALLRVQFLMAKQALESDGTICVYPVFIPLSKIVNSENIIANEVARRVNISSELADLFIKSGKFCLLLDGFNEILDISLKVIFAKQNDYLVKCFPNIKMILTDRNMTRSLSCTTLFGKYELHLLPISRELKREYFEENCKGEVLSVIMQSLANNPEYFDDINTPLKMKQLILCVDMDRKIPEPFVDSFLSAVIKRERLEKKDRNMDNMETLLAAFACILHEIFAETMSVIPNEQLVMKQMLAQVKVNQAKQVLGMGTPDVERFFDLAVNLDILRQFEKNIGFAEKSYFDCFYEYALDEGIDEYISSIYKQVPGI